MKNSMRGLLIALAIFASIQINAAPVFPIATNANAIEVSGGIASLGTNYLVSYLSGTNICTQLVNTNGALIGASVTNGHSQGLEFAYVASGTNYLAVWYDTFANSGYGQLLSRTNSRVGSAFALSYTPVGVASDGTNYLVLLEDENNDANNNDVFGQFVTGGGALSGGPFLIDNQQVNSGGSQGIVFGKTKYLVLNQADPNGGMGNDSDVLGFFVSPGGSVSAPFQISQVPSEDNDLSVPAVFDGTNFLVVWDWDPPPETEVVVTNWQVHGRLVSPTGTFPGNETILAASSGNNSLPTVAFDGTNYLLGWDDGFGMPGSPTIRFQFFNRSLNAVGTELTPFSAQSANVPIFAFNGLLYNQGQYVVAATFGTLAFSDFNFNGFPSAEVFGGFLSPSLVSSSFSLIPPRITSLLHNGSLTWINTAGTNAFILETASTVTGPWSYAAAPLDLTIATGMQTTVSNVPTASAKGFYLLQQGFGPQAFHGTWIALQAGTTNVANIYFGPDGNGTITNFGAFNPGTPPGVYEVASNGYFSGVANDADDGITPFAGQFSPPREIVLTGDITNQASTLLPVQNVSLCSGAWSGTLTDNTSYPGTYGINLAVTTNGFATLSGTYSGTGWIFSLAATNGAACAFFRTTSPSPFDQIQLNGTLTGNTFSGTYSVDDDNNTEGTVTLTR